MSQYAQVSSISQLPRNRCLLQVHCLLIMWLPIDLGRPIVARGTDLFLEYPYWGRCSGGPFSPVQHQVHSATDHSFYTSDPWFLFILNNGTAFVWGVSNILLFHSALNIPDYICLLPHNKHVWTVKFKFCWSRWPQLTRARSTYRDAWFSRYSRLKCLFHTA
jgi:hypothetical protein